MCCAPSSYIEDSPQLTARLQRYVELKQQLAELSAGGTIDEVEVERIKQEMENGFERDEEPDYEPIVEKLGDTNTRFGGDKSMDQSAGQQAILAALEKINGRLAALEAKLP